MSKRKNQRVVVCDYGSVDNLSVETGSLDELNPAFGVPRSRGQNEPDPFDMPANTISLVNKYGFDTSVNRKVSEDTGIDASRT